MGDMTLVNLPNRLRHATVSIQRLCSVPSVPPW
ncbi:MAG: hypothetical protein BWY56_01206 [Acidobacteria bacterium ADurb.Bin340]|nr:MAG: hypothetical protein BWY56_01206 [Acidobacteria bacterium ADurb.Bin340]